MIPTRFAGSDRKLLSGILCLGFLFHTLALPLHLCLHEHTYGHAPGPEARDAGSILSPREARSGPSPAAALGHSHGPSGRYHTHEPHAAHADFVGDGVDPSDHDHHVPHPASDHESEDLRAIQRWLAAAPAVLPPPSSTVPPPAESRGLLLDDSREPESPSLFGAHRKRGPPFVG